MKKVILGILIGLSLSTISVVAINLCNAKDIEYTSKDPSWDVDTVSDALNDLYENNSCDISDDVLDYLREISKTYEYKGSPDEFIAPINGIYKLEVWGAQGGSYNSTNCQGGKGGYAYGNIKLNKGEKLYVVVGGAGIGDGSHTYRAGGYNGGGNATSDKDGNTRQSSGGGATHIATETGLLSELSEKRDSILIVAGGGGGGAANVAAGCTAGGTGGGEKGGDGNRLDYNGRYFMGLGGTQDAGGNGILDGSIINSGIFGKGVDNDYVGGGGGYYGGGASISGGGGSGYLNPTRLIADTTGMSNGERAGNGYAKITFVSLN